MSSNDERPGQTAPSASSDQAADLRRQAEESLRECKEGLSFEELLLNISTRFLNLTSDLIDGEIENVQSQVCQFMGIEHCALWQWSLEGFCLTHVYRPYVGPPLPLSIKASEHVPWTLQQIKAGKMIAISSMEDIPEGAERDRETWRHFGIRSVLTFPLSCEGEIIGALNFSTVKRKHNWPEPIIRRLRLISQIFAGALAQKHAEEELREQLRFETLLAELSTRFVNLHADQVDESIEDAQRRVCECLGLDLSGLWQWGKETPRIFKMTHLYRPLGGPPRPEPMYAHEHFPWCQEQLEANKTVVISSTEDVPAEAARDQETWRRFGAKATLTFPLSLTGGPPIGALSFIDMQKERTWPAALIQRLQVVAQMFTNILIRKENDTALRESEERVSLTTEAVGAGLWVMEIDTKKVWVAPKTRELFHFSPAEEITYESFFKVIHPDDRERVDQAVQHTLQTGEFLHCDYRIVLPDGSIRWMVARGQRYQNLTGQPERMMGISFDITERKGLELRLDDSQTLLTSLVNSTPDLIWSVDSEHFGLLTFNRGLYEYFLRQRDFQIKAGMRPEDLFPTEDHYIQQWHMLYRKALDEGSFTTEYLTSAGAQTLRLNLNALKHGGAAFGVSVFAQEISAFKHLENQLRDSLEEVKWLRDRLQSENVYLRQEVKLLFKHAEIVGDSEPMKEVLAQAERVSATDSTVLILGETGTGKELLAHAIHEMSRRKDRALIIVNCASLPPTLIESELFGREKGAYTGSLTKMIGRFELADEGTLFLDEIGELPMDLQSKLLRVLEQGQFERLGSTTTIKVNIRLIAATNRDLAKDITEGRFRKDLYYRLNVFPLTVPPLRERKGDIPLLVWSFVKQFEKSLGKHIDSIPRKDMENLINYAWPGNIRELRNVVEHAMILNSSKTLALDLPTGATQEQPSSHALQDVERKHILEVLERTGWRISGKNGAAEILGMKRTTLQSKIKALSIARSG
jgi:PAS domain S-box-containing protein